MAVLQTRLAFSATVLIRFIRRADARACGTDFPAVARHIRAWIGVNTTTVAVCNFSVGTVAFFAFGTLFAELANGIA